VSIGLSWIGSWGLVWIAIAAVAAYAYRRRWLFLDVLLAIGSAELVVSLCHGLIHRHRPFEHQLGRSERTHSFPSGHAMTAFAGATMLAAYLPRYRVPLLALAALIALSRLYNGVHYPTDVLVGAATGVAIALLLRAAGRRRSRRGSRAG
jgi:undecaprenyl-diphosphatase